MKLSVAMCTYNGALYIKEQLDSILVQCIPVNEIVVCDDGSTDNTVDIVETYIEKYHNISWKLIRNIVKLGVLKNFEQALSLCTGDIIFLSDQDDIWIENKTERILLYLRENPNVSVLFTDARLIDGGGGIYEHSLFDVLGMNQLRDIWDSGMRFEVLNGGSRITGATMAVRKMFLSDVLPFYNDLEELHDGLLGIEGEKRGVLGILYESLIYYRLHDRNVIGLNMNFIPSRYKALNGLIAHHCIKKSFVNYIATTIEERAKFYCFRYTNYSTVLGVLKLLLSFHSYRRFYRSFAFMLWWRDVSFGFYRWVKIGFLK